MALSQWDIDVENNKNIIGGLGKKARSLLGSITNPADQVAPNVYNSGGAVSPTAPRQTPTAPLAPQDSNTIVKPAGIKTRATQPNPAGPVAPNARPSSMTRFTPEGGMASVKSTSPFPAPGSTLRNNGDPSNPRAVPVSPSRLAMAGNQTGITRGNGFEFQGTAADAAKFMAPVGSGPQMVPTGRMIQAVSTSDFLPKPQTGPQLPTYKGPESGIGWKTRAKMYETDMDTYNKQTGNQTALDVNAMQERGAGARALLQAKGQNDANDIARQRLAGDQQVNAIDIQGKQMGIDAEKRMEAVQQAYIAEKDPVKKRELGKQWLTLQGKDTSKFQITSKKGVAADGITPTETSYAVNPDNPSESFEIGGGGNSDPAMAAVNSNPDYQKAFAAASPSKQQEMLAAVRKRLQEQK